MTKLFLSNWKSTTGNNEIREKGCRSLARGDWSRLEILSLCTMTLIKLKTLLGRKELRIYQKGLGKIYKLFQSVLSYRKSINWWISKKLQMAWKSKLEKTVLARFEYKMLFSENNGIREKGCEYLSKLESKTI